MSAPTVLRPAPGASVPTASGGVVVLRAWRGEGSYARVYRAAYVRPGDGPLDATECALKLPKPEIAEAADRLRREGEVLAQLHHPRVVKLLDRGEGNAPFLALEWLEGETLLDLVRARRRLPLRQALELLAGLTEALAHCHERGVAHGDVRGQNLLVLPTRGAVLTDPEPVAPATPADDVRAAGALLSLMLTGQESPAGTALTTAGGHNRAVVELSARLASANPPSARRLLEEVQALRARL
jgi:serine/threonine protein kinase